MESINLHGLFVHCERCIMNISNQVLGADNMEEHREKKERKKEEEAEEESINTSSSSKNVPS